MKRDLAGGGGAAVVKEEGATKIDLRTKEESNKTCQINSDFMRPCFMALGCLWLSVGIGRFRIELDHLKKIWASSFFLLISDIEETLLVILIHNFAF